VLLLSSFLLTFGLLVVAILAAAVRFLYLPRKPNAYEALARSGTFAVVIAVGGFVVLVQLGVDLDRHFFGDLLQNGVILVLIGALTGTMFGAFRLRRAALVDAIGKPVRSPP
jgi:hypothetical protein